MKLGIILSCRKIADQIAVAQAAEARGWSGGRSENALDGGAHFYATYQCSDDKWISIGSIEPQFYALLLEKTGIDDPAFDAQNNRQQWPALTEKLAAIFATKTRQEWCDIMENTDVCFAPVLDMDEAPKHPHNVGRNTFQTIDGITQPAPAPRFSRTTAEIQGAPEKIGANSRAILMDLGLNDEQISALEDQAVI